MQIFQALHYISLYCIYMQLYHFIFISLIIKQMDTLCAQCHKFFGSQDKQFMCSVCYKQYKKLNNISQQIKKVQVQAPQPPKQADHSKCFKCSKKIGLLGYKCKQCDCSYCKFHRLPQQHQCQVNFVQMSKKQMQKKNPIISAPKVEQI